MVLSNIIGMVLNSMYSITCVFFVLPLKRLSIWIKVAVILLTILGYQLLKDETNAGNILGAIVIEFCITYFPVIFLCKGDPWRNIVIRIVFQMACVIFYYMEYMLYRLGFSRLDIEIWNDGLVNNSLGAQMINAVFTLLQVTLTCLLLRSIVKRWKPEHKRIYIWISIGYFICGIASGISSVKDIPDGEYNPEYSAMMLLMLSAILCVLISALYTKAEKDRLKAENAWYEEKIMDATGALNESTGLHSVVEQSIHRLEENRVRVNCFERLDNRTVTEEVELLVDKVFNWIRMKYPECVDIRIEERNDMLMIGVSVTGSQSPSSEIESDEIEELAEKLGGTAAVEKERLSVMVCSAADEGADKI